MTRPMRSATTSSSSIEPLRRAVAWALRLTAASVLGASGICAEPAWDTAVRETVGVAKDIGSGPTGPAVLSTTTEAATEPRWRQERSEVAVPVWGVLRRGVDARGDAADAGEGLGLGLRGRYSLTRRVAVYALVSESFFRSYQLSRYDETLVTYDAVIPRGAGSTYAETAYGLVGTSVALSRTAAWTTQGAVWRSRQSETAYFRDVRSILHGSELTTRVEDDVTPRHRAQVALLGRRRVLDLDGAASVDVQDAVVTVGDRWNLGSGRDLTGILGKVVLLDTGDEAPRPILGRLSLTETAPHDRVEATVSYDFDADPSRFPPGAERTARVSGEHDLSGPGRWTWLGLAEALRFDGLTTSLGASTREDTALVRSGFRQTISREWQWSVQGEMLWTKSWPSTWVVRPGAFIFLEWRPERA